MYEVNSDTHQKRAELINEFVQEVKAIKTPQDDINDLLKEIKPAVVLLFKKGCSISEILSRINSKFSNVLNKNKVKENDLKKILKIKPIKK